MGMYLNIYLCYVLSHGDEIQNENVEM